MATAATNDRAGKARKLLERINSTMATPDSNVARKGRLVANVGWALALLCAALVGFVTWRALSSFVSFAAAPAWERALGVGCIVGAFLASFRPILFILVGNRVRLEDHPVSSESIAWLLENGARYPELRQPIRAWLESGHPIRFHQQSLVRQYIEHKAKADADAARDRDTKQADEKARSMQDAFLRGDWDALDKAATTSNGSAS